MSSAVKCFLCVLLLAAVCPVLAQEAKKPPPEKKLSLQEMLAKYRELMLAIQNDFKEKQYEQAEKDCHRLIDLVPRDPSGPYNLACAEARLGKPDLAFAALEKAVNLGFTDTQHIQSDADLESVRKDKRMDAIIARAKVVQAETRKGRYEKPGEMAGVKTVNRQPEGGLRFHLRMPPGASKQKPARLVIWLHPSGGSMNGAAESLVLRLNRNGYALLVPDQKQWMNWSGAEMSALMNISLADAGKVEGIDPRKPILLGFSAGGQAALMLWSDNPGSLGGLVLDAAYPIKMEADTKTGRVVQKPLVPPKVADGKFPPILVLVGEKDQEGRGLAIWRKAEAAWRKAGVPLTIQTVPGKGHQWLFGPKEADALETWLKLLAASQITPPPAR